MKLTAASKSDRLFERAGLVMPGGVNSPVRAFKSVGGSPRFIKSAKGANITDVDGKEYIDYVGSWGPMILGHANEIVLEAVSKAMVDGISFGAATEKEVLMAELVTSIVPSVEQLRMVNSGTEAVMSALRLARGFTGRDKIIKFEGCYHGHTDSMLVKAGSGALTYGSPSSSGVTAGTAKDTLIAEYNSIESVEQIFSENQGEIACIIVEPVAANMGVVLPRDGFLQKLRALCDKNNALLIFDEVITGFRLAIGGAQEYYGVTADLVTYGKIIGGGMPVGAYGGRREIMECVAPSGTVYQAGTLSGNPLAMSAGLATLEYLSAHSEVYDNINQKTNRLVDGLRSITTNTINSVGSLACIFITEDEVNSYETAVKSDTSRYAQIFKSLLNDGVYTAPAQFEALFVSNCHTTANIDYTIEAYKKAFAQN